jgi:hypothetical protein
MAASDAVTLLRLAQGAAYRVGEHAHGGAYARAERLSAALQDVLREAEALEATVKRDGRD